MRAIIRAFVSLAFFVAALPGFAQTSMSTGVPSVIRYGGILKNGGGSPSADRTVGVTFAIYSQQEGGAPLWLESQNVQTDGSGHYSVLLGSTTATGLPGDLFAPQEERWLGVRIEGQQEQARVLLVSVPYALKAAEAKKAQDAATLGGLPASSYALASQVNQNTQPTSTNANPSVEAQISTRATGTVSHGTTGYLAMWLNQVYIGDSLVFQSTAGNVGIGNATPASKLDVNGGINASSYKISGNTVLYANPFANAVGGNVFVGVGAGAANTTGTLNSFTGYVAGSLNTTGSYNSYFGQCAGCNNATGSSNVYIGNSGVASESNTIRIGTQGTGNGQQTSAYIVGIYGNSPTGALPVVVNANGQLGTTTSGIGVTSFNGRTGAVVSAANDYSFPLLSGTLASTQLSGTYSNPVSLTNTRNSVSGTFIGNGAAITGLQFSQLAGSLPSAQFSGTYSNAVALTNAGNAFNGTFTGNGSGLTGIGAGQSWPVVSKSADYAVQLSDFSNASRFGNFLVLIGSLSHTFTLPNPAPPSGSCVAIGDFAVAGIGSNTNVFLSVSSNGLNIDGGSPGNATHGRRVSNLYCSDGAGYWRLGRQQNGVSQIGPWLYTQDTGTVNVMKTTFINGLDFGMNTGTMFYILPKFANTVSGPTLEVNGLGPRTIVKFGNQPLAPGDLTTSALANVIFDGTFWQLLNPQTSATLSGITASIGGSLLAAGACDSASLAITGVTNTMDVHASPETYPGDGFWWQAYVPSSGTVTVKVCAAISGTPSASLYHVRVLQ